MGRRFWWVFMGLLVATTLLGLPELAGQGTMPIEAGVRVAAAAPFATGVVAVTTTATGAPTGPTAAPAPVGPTVIATPTARPVGAPWRVGLQVGHLRSNELPDELARLRSSTGAQWGGVSEAELNLAIAERVKPLLEAAGVVVDLLPATVPPSYDADAFVAIHADGSRSGAASGWKLATAWRASRASQDLYAAVRSTYGVATGLPEDVGGVTENMRGYYAFSYRRYVHTIARTTPAIIVEMGFMTSAVDRGVLFGQPDRVARGIADGILAYLARRDRSDGAALLPPEFPVMRGRPEGSALRSAPDDRARVVALIGPNDRFVPFVEANGWYEGWVRGRQVTGFVRVDQVVPTDEQPAEPTPTNP